MSRKRRAYESGHKPKFLVVVDDTPGVRPRGAVRRAPHARASAAGW